MKENYGNFFIPDLSHVNPHTSAHTHTHTHTRTHTYTSPTYVHLYLQGTISSFTHAPTFLCKSLRALPSSTPRLVRWLTLIPLREREDVRLCWGDWLPKGVLLEELMIQSHKLKWSPRSKYFVQIRCRQGFKSFTPNTGLFPRWTSKTIAFETPRCLTPAEQYFEVCFLYRIHIMLPVVKITS